MYPRAFEEMESLHIINEGVVCVFDTSKLAIDLECEGLTPSEHSNAEKKRGRYKVLCQVVTVEFDKQFCKIHYFQVRVIRKI